MTIESRLAEIRARAEAATEGPWTAEYSGEQGNCVLPPGYQSTREAVAVTRLLSAQPDAEFIAASRTDLPALLAAVEAVRGLHTPIERRDGPVCDHCLHSPRVGAYPYPCPTVQALSAALEMQG